MERGRASEEFRDWKPECGQKKSPDDRGFSKEKLWNWMESGFAAGAEFADGGIFVAGRSLALNFGIRAA